MIRKLVYFLLFGMIFTSGLNAQEGQNPLQEVAVDDLGEVNDAFREYFFEALKQKAIENYEKAIVALQKAEKIQPNNAVIYFELGKNYKSLNDLDNAINNFQKANRLQPNREWILQALMESYYLNKQYEQAILVNKKLVAYNEKYYDDLAKMYFELQQFDKLIALLDQLDIELGITEYRNSLRQQIYALTNNTSAQIKTLEESITLNPENEMNYLNLIYVYSDEGLEKEAFETAQKMQQLFPTSKVVHLALYKFYLNNDRTDEALSSMRLVLESEEIDATSKFKVLNDFLLFVNEHAGYDEELKQVAALFSKSENNPGIFQKFGDYFLQKNEKEQALSFFEMGIGSNIDNYELLRNTLLLQLDLLKFKEASELSGSGLEIFPAQALLYLIKGAALNNLKKYNEALEILTFGLDYLIDDIDMERDFYAQLSVAHSGLGNTPKATEFKEKANSIKKTEN
ncbi:TPR repeat protein [Gillisia sp. Hel_I_86]|uniref:tetratricopeptide repeat protein n=1 Tax=Gillisia sp. Hel_I_86 TaxID=1249981 RepID=UPI00119A3AB3|nr:tetratricopeptide repeat protein [Gillisia sp. Hel_I_86]TVZ26266.1 TPR repeat protein [Gillisia sp. Hel_I_86]